jgi:hypothetical protein
MAAWLPTARASVMCVMTVSLSAHCSRLLVRLHAIVGAGNGGLSAVVGGYRHNPQNDAGACGSVDIDPVDRLVPVGVEYDRPWPVASTSGAAAQSAGVVDESLDGTPPANRDRGWPAHEVPLMPSTLHPAPVGRIASHHGRADNQNRFMFRALVSDGVVVHALARTFAGYFAAPLLGRPGCLPQHWQRTSVLMRSPARRQTWRSGSGRAAPVCG